MTAGEDPAPPLSTAAAGAPAARDDLEHWLSDLRTDVAADPPGWIDAEPVDIDAEPVEEGSTRVGRHRTPD